LPPYSAPLAEHATTKHPNNFVGNYSVANNFVVIPAHIPSQFAAPNPPSNQRVRTCGETAG
ncbi:MAG: hypothetical protein ACYTEX_21385, partial [Planctomycetota bacterium]|jgi:hypothetical protein